MHFTFATVGTLLAGLVVLGASLLRGLRAKDRLWAAIGGGLITVYALWGITRTSGTFYYNPLMFLIPVLLLGSLALRYFVGKRPDTPVPPAATTPPAEGFVATGTSSPEPSRPAYEAPAWVPEVATGVQPAAANYAFAPFVPEASVATPTASIDAWAQPAAESPAEMTVVRGDLEQLVANLAQPSVSLAAIVRSCQRCGFTLRAELSACPRCGAPTA